MELSQLYLIQYVSQLGTSSFFFVFRPNSLLSDDEFVPHEGPGMSKFGPISRMAKNFMQPGNPYMESPLPGPGSRQSVPSSSPMASMLLHNVQGMLFFTHTVFIILA